jgi:predicted nucleic acid-binding protein
MIVDASVAAKWVFVEEDSALATGLLARDDLSVPDLIFAEMANIVWRRGRGQDPAEAASLLARIDRVFALVAPAEELAQSALSLALALNHPAYDCFYLALAIAEDDVLITADRRFHAACAASPHAARVRLLGDVQIQP